MTSKPRPLFAAALLFWLLAGNSIWAQSQDQTPLGDVARHKPAVKAKRVVTNDEVPPSSEANNVPSPTSSTPKEPDSAVAPAGADLPASKNANPSGQQAKLQKLTADNERLLKVVKDLEARIADTPDQQRKATLTEVLQHVRQQMFENQKEMARLRAPAPAEANPPARGQQPPAPRPPK
jgi:hypothetical protein